MGFLFRAYLTQQPMSGQSDLTQGPHRLTPATAAASVIRDGPPAREVKREAGANSLNAGAAPATVSDEPRADATGIPGKAADGNDPRARRPAITNCALEASSGRGAPDGSEPDGDEPSARPNKARGPTAVM